MKKQSIIAVAAAAVALGALTATAFAHAAFSGSAATPVATIPLSQVGVPAIAPSRQPWWGLPQTHRAGTGGIVFVNGYPR